MALSHAKLLYPYFVCKDNGFSSNAIAFICFLRALFQEVESFAKKV
jgi:hypothetical protein